MGRGNKKNKKPAAAVPVAASDDKGKEEEDAVAPDSHELTTTLPLTEPLSSCAMDAMVEDLFPELCISCTLLERMCRHILLTHVDSGQVPTPDVLREYRYLCRDLGNCCGSPRRHDDHYGLDSQHDTLSETGQFWKPVPETKEQTQEQQD